MFQTRACVEENVILTDGNSLAKHIHPGGHHFCAYFLVHVFAKNKRKRLFTTHFSNDDHKSRNTIVLCIPTNQTPLFCTKTNIGNVKAAKAKAIFSLIFAAIAVALM